MSKKDLKYYQNLEYNIIIERQEVNNENWYIAYTFELGKLACYGRGDTKIEALNSFLEEKNFHIEYLYNEGLDVPEPNKESTEKFSGIFNIRTTPVIHSKLVYQAKDMGISLNLYINQILSSAVDLKSNENAIMNKLSELCGKLDAHHFEVTKQLKYQNRNQYPRSEWSVEYSDSYLISA